MSIRLMAQVFEADLPHAEKLVCLALADHGRDDGSRIYPSIATVAAKTGYSERSVQRVLRRLQEREVLAVVKITIRYGTTEYRIRCDKLTPLPYFSGDRHDRKKGAGCHQGGDKDGQKGCQDDTRIISESKLKHHKSNPTASSSTSYSKPQHTTKPADPIYEELKTLDTQALFDLFILHSAAYVQSDAALIERARSLFVRLPRHDARNQDLQAAVCCWVHPGRSRHSTESIHSMWDLFLNYEKHYSATTQAGQKGGDDHEQRRT